jgi:hypothetical protein
MSDKKPKTAIGWKLMKDGKWIDSYIQRTGDAVKNYGDHPRPPSPKYPNWGYQDGRLPYDVLDEFEVFIGGWTLDQQVEPTPDVAPMKSYKGFSMTQYEI